MPKTSFTTRCDIWEPPTTLHQTDLEHKVEVVDRGALHSFEGVEDSEMVRW